MNEKERTLRLVTKNPEETLDLGESLGNALEKGHCVALFGELGSGKTLLTRGIARGLEVPENVYVTSPTFTIINEYPGRIPLYHVDLYRIGDPGEFEELGLDELIHGNGVTVVEWAEKLPEALLRSFDVFVELIVSGDEERELKLISKEERLFWSLEKHVGTRS